MILSLKIFSQFLTLIIFFFFLAKSVGKFTSTYVLCGMLRLLVNLSTPSLVTVRNLFVCSKKIGKPPDLTKAFFEHMNKL